MLIPPGVPARAASHAAPRKRRCCRTRASSDDARLIAIAGPLRAPQADRRSDLVLRAGARASPRQRGCYRRRRPRSPPSGTLRLASERAGLRPLSRLSRRPRRPAAARRRYWQLERPATTPLALLEAMAAGPGRRQRRARPSRRDRADRTGLLVPLGDRADVARATDQLLANRASWPSDWAAAAASAIAERWSLDATLAAFDGCTSQLATEAETTLRRPHGRDSMRLERCSSAPAIKTPRPPLAHAGQAVRHAESAAATTASPQLVTPADGATATFGGRPAAADLRALRDDLPPRRQVLGSLRVGS